MRLAHYWTDRTRVLAQVVLLGCCVSIVVAAREVVDADTKSDRFELAWNTAALAALVVSIVLSQIIMRATRARLPRASVASLSVAIVCLGGAFVRLAYADVSVELASLIEPAQAAEATSQIVVGPTGTDVRLSGDIEDGAADRLDKILAANPSIERIHLTSDGGDADEGRALAEVIAAHGLATYVPDYCVSACTLAFAGGRRRILMEGARLGFHAPYQQGLFGQTFAGDPREQRAAYIEAGLSADFVDEALKVSPDDIWIPTRDRLLAAHVVTGYVDRYVYPDSILDGSADGQGARRVVLRNFAVLESIDAVAPQAVDRIAAAYLRAYRRGTSEGEATDALERIVGATITLVLARADDATLLDVARFVLPAMSAAAPSRACATIGARVVRAAAAATSAGRDGDALAASLVRRALTSGRAGSPRPGIASVAYDRRDESCASSRQVYVDAVRRRDVTALRREVRQEAPRAARLLAPLAASMR